MIVGVTGGQQPYEMATQEQEGIHRDGTMPAPTDRCVVHATRRCRNLIRRGLRGRKQTFW